MIPKKRWRKFNDALLVQGQEYHCRVWPVRCRHHKAPVECRMRWEPRGIVWLGRDPGYGRMDVWTHFDAGGGSKG